WTECAELIDHIGWKWWAEQKPNLTQAKLEVVDIWHFYVSWMIKDEGPFSIIIEHFKRGDGTGTDVLGNAENLARCAASYYLMASGQSLVWLTESMEMSFEDVYLLYIGKNILNEFRQKHGYKEGKYSKVWFDGREDNEHLMDAVEGYDDAFDFKKFVEGILTSGYLNKYE
ncbi:MAG: dUTP diphosphatase, partial [Gammaproteobacteria bacterium]